MNQWKLLFMHGKPFLLLELFCDSSQAIVYNAWIKKKTSFKNHAKIAKWQKKYSLGKQFRGHAISMSF